MRVTLATWNVLADCYSHAQSGVRDRNGEWPYRCELARACLTEATESIDVFCMQEVDHFDDFYSELFHSLGFATVYMQRPTKNDGCLIAFRSDRFDLKATQLIDLDQLSHLDRQLQRTGRSKFAKQNVTVLAVLADKASGRRFLVATCHLHWNPNLPEVKFAQAYYVLDRITAFRESHGGLPVVFTGDFNSLPQDEVYRFLTGTPFLKANAFETIEKALACQVESTSYTYGPRTRFLCDSSLSRLCRWLRILGVDVAQDTWDMKADASTKSDIISAASSPRSANVSGKSVFDHGKRQSVNAFFARAKAEKRVILTTSKTLIARSSCPPSYYVQANKLEEAMVDIYREFGLDLRKERFLTVCGKCGGEIEETSRSDPRMEGKSFPSDRQVFICVSCGQPYWWSELENSSPAKALKQADALYELIMKGLQAATAEGRTRSHTPVPSRCAPSPLVVMPAAPATDPDEVFIKHIRDWGEECGIEVSGLDGDAEPAEGHFVSTPSRSSSPDRASTSNVEGLSARFTARNSLLTSGSLRARAELAVEEDGRPPLGHHIPHALQALKLLNIADRDSSGCSSAVDSGLTTPVEHVHAPDAHAAQLVQLTSVFAEHEPVLTNWNGDFHGTLDYIFLSKGWAVESARVAPKAVLPEERKPLATTDDLRKKGIFAEVHGSQPSDQWSSDHFMIIANLQLL